ncbi:hypothetical protein CYLTODRAFT_495545 [Cylindrobasidium torrendii FP15055 ss-10]|uniref:Uncharacterized protein n=1 Tax=Cylindrobasidium torrendii FP15055 ss-10 TaxID=1314674 RepID=A0A0D7AQT6_9AGAR|nr:hypothetical protein CYLTODRAFT_495545 [Cylindrobasidium torrendii FP15055 ss-10]
MKAKVPNCNSRTLAHSHSVQRGRSPCLPVLIGQGIPRSDLGVHKKKYAIYLFKPRARDAANPTGYKDEEEAAWDVFKQDLEQRHVRATGHFQEQWECRRAADDYSSKYKKTWKNYRMSNSLPACYNEEAEFDKLCKDATFMASSVQG